LKRNIPTIVYCHFQQPIIRPCPGESVGELQVVPPSFSFSLFILSIFLLSLALLLVDLAFCLLRNKGDKIIKFCKFKYVPGILFKGASFAASNVYRCVASVARGSTYYLIQ
jgi:hypothetical protein